MKSPRDPRRSTRFLVAVLALVALAPVRCGGSRAGVPAEPNASEEESVMEDDSVLSRPAPLPDRVIAYGPGEGDVAEVRFGGPEAERRPLVILVHGGFWRPAYDRVHTRPLSQALAAAGWTVVTPEYRRIPGDPQATLHDVRLALETLPARVGHHNGEVLLIGHSAGGHLVLWAAAAGLRIPLRGVLALAPVADLRLASERHLGGGAVEAFLGGPPEEHSDLDPIRMPEPQARITILEGEGDEIVPPEIAESYAKARPKARLVPIRRAAHFALIDPESVAWPVVLEELERLAKP